MTISGFPLYKRVSVGITRRPSRTITRKVVIPRASIQPLGVPLESWAHAFTFGVFIYTSMNYLHYKNLVKKIEVKNKPPKKK